MHKNNRSREEGAEQKELGVIEDKGRRRLQRRGRKARQVEEEGGRQRRRWWRDWCVGVGVGGAQLR